MRPDRFRQWLGALAVLALLLPQNVQADAGSGESGYGIAMYGAPALPPDFVSLPYARPDAPKGGTLVMGEVGGFDSLNPYILKGLAPYWLGRLTVETLMVRSIDEPFTLYAGLAEFVRTDSSRSWVEFTLNPKARFSDGKPVTPEDVLWSMETLGTKGSPVYYGAWKKVAKAEQVGPLTVRFSFAAPDRELPLILGLRPVLEKAQWAGKDFAASSLEVPIGSGPYVVDKVDPGREISFRRNPDWWGKDLPVNRGRFNFDAIKDEYFADSNVLFEAFKAGELNFYREGNPHRWLTNYGFPAVTSGAVKRAEIPQQSPSGMIGLVFNTRRAIFADWRVREALIEAFNYEFINRTINAGTEPRITSYFSNSALGMDHGPAAGRVKDLLAPFAADLPPGAMEGYALPVSDGSEGNRTNLRKAMHLLNEAGWTPQGGVLKNAKGELFSFDILMHQGTSDLSQAADIFIQSLKRLGITARQVTVDDAQFNQRSDAYDFDMTTITRSLSLSPGNEQSFYWGSAGANQPGGRNLMGVASPAVDAMIRVMLQTTERDEFVAAVKALDRVLMAGRYVIPVWFPKVSRIAYGKALHYPERLPIYGDWPGFLPDVWWSEE